MYLLTISSPDIDNVAMSLYNITKIIVLWMSTRVHMYSDVHQRGILFSFNSVYVCVCVHLYLSNALYEVVLTLSANVPNASPTSLFYLIHCACSVCVCVCVHAQLTLTRWLCSPVNSLDVSP